MAKISEELEKALQGVFPSTLATCSADGEPNVTYVSQVYFVDDEHVALSFQFFNKTASNVRENPKASVIVGHPETGEEWRLELEYDRSETEGLLFDNMNMQLEAIASVHGMEDIFKLKAADVYKVISIERLKR